jgi:hypothetical protein
MSRRRVLVALLAVAVWALVLLALGFHFTAHQPPSTTTTTTVRR